MPNLYSHSGLLIGIHCTSSLFASQAAALSTQFDIPLVKNAPEHLDAGCFLLCLTEQGLVLQSTGKKAAGPVMVDFIHGANAHRRQFGGGKGQMIAKAVGLKGTYKPHIADVTAGLGQDGFVLATLGCQITLVERSPIVYSLLKDGLARAQLVTDGELLSIIDRMALQYANAIDYLRSLSDPIDIVYLDPMFPERKNKAEVNKSMKAFHSLVGDDSDAGELLQLALEKALYRVVVKRPRKAPTLAEQYPHVTLPKPSLVFEGKSTRYDVYPLKKMP